MTNLVDRPSSERGSRRRDQLVSAGIDALCDGGWPAATARGVAERAGANQGLIHYHFGGLPGLHAAIARRAGEMIIGSLVDELLSAADERAAIEVIRRMLPETAADERATRLAVELIAGAARDPALGEIFRDQLREARRQIADRLGELHPGRSRAQLIGQATTVVALIDGLALHYLLDPDLPVNEALQAMEEQL